MRMFTEVGRRVLPHATAVGKTLLAQLPDTELAAVVGRTGLPARTPHTVVTLAALRAELERVRVDGFATDEEEQELGVRCVAAALPEGPLPLAFSVSGPVPRMTAELMDRAVPALRAAASGFATDLAAPAGAVTIP